MKWKTALVLFITTLAVGSYVSLYELKRPTVERQRELHRQVLRISPDEATGLSVALPAVTATLERRDAAWHLSRPLSTRAEASQVERTMMLLDPLEAQDILEGSSQHPLALAEYGLEPARGTLTVTAGSRTTTLLFGETTAVGGNRYVKLQDSPNVCVVDAELFNALNQPLDAWRSHAVLDFDASLASQVSVASATVSYTLTHEADRWAMNAPFADAADSAAVAALLAKLRDLRAERFVSDAPTAEELAAWGLQTPAAHIAIGLGQDRAPAELSVGNAAADTPAFFYAKRPDGPTVYLVAKASIEALFQDPQTLRSHALFELFNGQAAKIHVEGPQVSWTLEAADGVWKDEAGTQDVDATKVGNWLGKLQEMKFTRVVEDQPQDLTRYGLAPPAGTIQLWLKDEEAPQQLLMGNFIASGKTRYGMISGRPSVVELPETTSELFATKPDAFTTEPSPAPLP